MHFESTCEKKASRSSRVVTAVMPPTKIFASKDCATCGVREGEVYKHACSYVNVNCRLPEEATTDSTRNSSKQHTYTCMNASTVQQVPMYCTRDRDMQYHTKPQQPKQRQSHTESMTAAPPQPGTCLHTHVYTHER